MINGHELSLLRGDITRIDADAIVNAANQDLIPGGGVSGAIHRAGGPAIEQEARTLPGTPRCPTGQAVATTAGRLSARHVIHAVAPIWRGGSQGEPALLADAYRNSLRLADSLGDRSIAFPSLGTGIYGYPLEEGARIALETVIAYLRGETKLERVTFVLFSERDLQIYEQVLDELTDNAGTAR